MITKEQIEKDIAAFVAELFAGNGSPMEGFGITWSQAQALEHKNPGMVIKIASDDVRCLACC